MEFGRELVCDLLASGQRNGIWLLQVNDTGSWYCRLIYVLKIGLLF